MKAIFYSKYFGGAMLILLAVIAFTGVFNIGMLESGMMVAMATPVIVDLEEPGGDSCGISGVKTIAYVIPTADIDAVAKLKDIKSTQEDYSVLVGNHILKAGKFFMEFWSEDEMGSFTANPEGQKSSVFYRSEGSLFYPRNSKQAIGIANMFKGVKMLIILQDRKTGNMISLGNKDIPYYLQPSIASGQAFGDDSGVTFNITGASCSINIYEGAIPLENDIMNAPITLVPDVTNVDANIGTSFEIGLNTSPQIISTITNLSAGQVLKIAYTSNSADTTTISAFDTGQTIILAAVGDWVDIYLTGAGIIIKDAFIQ